jgi:NAD-dependent DNA ligase
MADAEVITNDVKIEKISHHVGRFGIIVPILKLDKKVPTINKDGTHLTMDILTDFITLQDAGRYVTYNIKEGDVVDLRTTWPTNNAVPVYDVIAHRPCEEDAFLKYVIPEKCPACGKPVREYTGQYICNNALCTARLLERNTHFVRSIHMHLHGVYHTIFSTLIARKFIRSPIDIFTTADHAVLETLDTISAKHLSTYKALVCDVIGKVSMTELLIGLDIIPYYNDTDIIRNFVTYMQEMQANEYGNQFDIDTFIEVVDRSVNDFNIVNDDANNINMQILKLSDEEHEAISNRFGNIGSHAIAIIMDYVLNDDNRELLKRLGSIGLLRS